MNASLVVPISVLAGAIALAFYMDWLGLWVSKEEMKDQIDRAKERMANLENQSPNLQPGSGDAVVGPRPTVRDYGRHVSEPEYEPVHGLTKPQRDDYLAHNPAYVPTYEAELQENLPASPGSSWMER